MYQTSQQGQGLYMSWRFSGHDFMADQVTKSIEVEILTRCIEACE